MQVKTELKMILYFQGFVSPFVLVSRCEFHLQPANMCSRDCIFGTCSCLLAAATTDPGRFKHIGNKRGLRPCFGIHFSPAYFIILLQAAHHYHYFSLLRRFHHFEINHDCLFLNKTAIIMNRFKRDSMYLAKQIQKGFYVPRQNHRLF